MARQEFTRPRVTVEDIVKAHGGLKRVGSQLEGSCPCCGGTKRFHVNAEPGDNGKPLGGCRDGCTLPDVCERLGLPWGNGGAGPAGIGKRAIERAIEPPARPYEPTGREGMSKDWICAGPDGTARHLRRPVVNPDGTTGKVVTWPTGTKTKRLAPPAPPVQRSQKKAGGGKVESDKGTAPATAVVGDQEGAAPTKPTKRSC